MTQRMGVERIEKLVENAIKNRSSLPRPSIHMLFKDEIVTLICRELAKERGRVRGVINKLRGLHMVGSTRVVEEADFNYAYMAACDEILTALSGRKGTR